MTLSDSVTLTEAERLELWQMLKHGSAPTRTLTRARVLLLTTEGVPEVDIARHLLISYKTVRRIQARAAAEGVTAALGERPRPGAARKLDGTQEAVLVALACSPPPDGRVTWTMQLLADTLVELQIVDAISDETVRRTLKKTRSSRGSAGTGVSRQSARTSSRRWKTCSNSMPPR